MPVFEYRCTDCGADHEAIVLPPEPAPTTCPGCGGGLRRRWSRVGVQLVGWGFARNDALVADDGHRKDYKTLRDKAAELFD
ncbi:MAG TPA: zinc ribbon domain-containing protein [Actinomycetota bacterium]|nr:zinc ribbon domain-containing protein [Actinomycetota bacterium]